MLSHLLSTGPQHPQLGSAERPPTRPVQREEPGRARAPRAAPAALLGPFDGSDTQERGMSTVYVIPTLRSREFDRACSAVAVYFSNSARSHKRRGTIRIKGSLKCSTPSPTRLFLPCIEQTRTRAPTCRRGPAATAQTPPLFPARETQRYFLGKSK